MVCHRINFWILNFLWRINGNNRKYIHLSYHHYPYICMALNLVIVNFSKSKVALLDIDGLYMGLSL